MFTYDDSFDDDIELLLIQARNAEKKKALENLKDAKQSVLPANVEKKVI
jgi:hypothetical protein